MIFYFNHTTSIPNKKPIECFEKLMWNYRKLTQRPELHIEKGIVTQEDPQSVAMGHLSLNDFIKGIKDKDFKRWIYGQFEKYPADLYYKVEQVYQEYAELDYSYFVEEKESGVQINATHLLAPARLGWCLLTIPISKTWLNHQIILKCSSEDGQIQPLMSFHGDNDENFNAIAKWLIINHYHDEKIDRVETKIAWLKNCIGKREVRISQEFEKRFRELATDEQKNATGLVSTAFTRSMLFPIKADNQLIKSCRSKGNEATYELRDIGKGIRIYFQCYNDILFLGGIHTKAEGVGDEQSADINHATRVCENMIEQ